MPSANSSRNEDAHSRDSPSRCRYQLPGKHGGGIPRETKSANRKKKTPMSQRRVKSGSSIEISKNEAVSQKDRGTGRDEQYHTNRYKNDEQVPKSDKSKRKVVNIKDGAYLTNHDRAQHDGTDYKVVGGHQYRRISSPQEEQLRKDTKAAQYGHLPIMKGLVPKYQSSPFSTQREGVASPEDHASDVMSSSRALSSLSFSSNLSVGGVTINTNSPISAWGNFKAPNETELRKRLLKGKLKDQFESYYPGVSRKKLLTAHAPSDDEEYDTDLEEDSSLDLASFERSRQRKEDSPFPDYKRLCRKLGVIPNNYFIRHALDDDFSLKFRYPGVNDVKALSEEIKNDATICKLDMSDNGLVPQQLLSLAKMLMDNTTVTDANFSDNKIGSTGARMLRCVLKSGCRLTSLNLSGNRIGDKGVRYLVSGLERNVFLKELNLSHNEIGEGGMKYMCPFLANNVTLDALDISWNHIRKQGAVMLANAIEDNQQLRVLNVSMNGFNLDGARALGDALAENGSLLELDVSANRVPRLGAEALASGLALNTELQRLRIGFNPLTPEGAQSILDAAERRNNSDGLTLDFEGVYVHGPFESQAISLMDDNKVKVVFTLENSRRGRNRDLTSTYIYSLIETLREMKFDAENIFADITEDNVIFSGSDVIQRLLIAGLVRQKVTAAYLNHFIATNGNRRFLVRDWQKIAQQRQVPHDVRSPTKSMTYTTSITSGSPLLRPVSSFWWQDRPRTGNTSRIGTPSLVSVSAMS